MIAIDPTDSAVRGSLFDGVGAALGWIGIAVGGPAVVLAIIAYNSMTAFGGHPLEETSLRMSEIHMRVELAGLKHGLPSTSAGFSSVYGSDPVPKDFWHHDFVYVPPGPNGEPFDLISYGSDGVPGGVGNAADITWSEAR